MTKILVADDHAIVRVALKQIFSETPDLVLADEACDGFEVLDKIRRDDFDLVVLDISMPGKGGLDTLKQLKIEKPQLPVLILSIHDEEQYAMRVFKAGAAGYLTKKTIPEELVAAIRKVMSGKKYVSQALAEKLVGVLDTDMGAPPHQALSDREFQVLCMIGAGKKPAEIAAELHLSVKTVHTYRSRILDKLHLNTNAELTYYAVKEGLVE